LSERIFRIDKWGKRKRVSVCTITCAPIAARRHRNVLAIALANKLVRIA
jgi:hypothetical protein